MCHNTGPSDLTYRTQEAYLTTAKALVICLQLYKYYGRRSGNFSYIGFDLVRGVDLVRGFQEQVTLTFFLAAADSQRKLILPDLLPQIHRLAESISQCPSNNNISYIHKKIPLKKFHKAPLFTNQRSIESKIIKIDLIWLLLLVDYVNHCI